MRDAKNAKAGERGRRWNAAHTVKGIAALAIAVVGGGVAWWLVGGRGQTSVPSVPDVPCVPSVEKQKIADRRQTRPIATSEPLPKPTPAPTPTNDVQRAIWNQVHAIPDRPMTIEFDPKKDK